MVDVSECWKNEYNKTKGIPSSYRTQPSHVVSDFFYPKIADQYTTPSQAKVLDLGCGQGRNAFFFAGKGFDVSAIDIVPDNIAYMRQYAVAYALNIHPLCQDVTQELPFSNQSIDIVIDIFCYKHQVDAAQRKFYRKELYRLLKDDGYYLLSLADKKDGYYGPLLNKNMSDNRITDPVVGIDSILFDRKEIESEFSQFFVQESQTTEKLGLMHGNEYLRVTHAFVMRKK